MNCKGKTTSGAPCKMPPLKGKRHCFTHDPANRAAQAEARKRGGEARHTPHAGNPATIPADIASLTDAGKILNYVLAELLVMDNGIPRARALLSAYEMYLESIKVGEFEKRLEALEAREK
jgi:hypothetical protein